MCPQNLQVIGEADLPKIIRMQFARMRPGTRIKPHTDLGRWASGSHRIHIPVTVAPGVGFAVRNQTLLPFVYGEWCIS